MPTNRRVLLASRPTGWVSEANFKVEDAPLPAPADGQVLVKNLWLSLDPYMRGRMNEGKSYAAKQELGEVMIGGTVGEVVESKHPKFAKGDQVLGMLGICQPKAGETVVVSAASGAVGSVVGQIAKIKGCRAVGIAGGRQKCDY